MNRPLSFLDVAWKNLLRRPSRSLLTIASVAAAVAAVIALMTVASGFERTWTSAYAARDIDLIVGRLTARRPVPTPFSGRLAADLRKFQDVEEAAGTLTDLVGVEDAPAMVVSGWEADSFLWRHLRLVQGRWPPSGSERAVALGVVAAEILGKSVGDRVQVDTFDFTVCGIFTSPALSENGTVLMTLSEFQAISGRDDLVSSINVKLKSPTTADAAERVRAAVRERFPGFSVFTVGEIVQNNLALQAGKAVSLAVSLITLAVGTVGVMNTMLMSVFERLHEIAVLLAMGWRRRRIVRLILLESLMLSFAGNVVGTLVGVGALRALQSASWFRGKIDATVDAPLLVGVLIATLVLGVAAGLYPAWVGARMRPADGLRYE